MKSLLMSLALVSSFSSAAFAGGTQFKSFSAVITDLQQDPQEQNKVVGGTIAVNFEMRTVTLTLQPAMPPCPAGFACMQVMPPAEVIEVKLKKIDESYCGDTFVGLIDARPVDGLLQKITVKDYSRALCEMVIPNVIEVTYEKAWYNRMSHGESKLTSHFSAYSKSAALLYFP